MPRAKSPDAYPAYMHDLRDVLASTSEIKLAFNMPKQRAWHIRQSFYAYIGAWRHEEARLRKLGDMEAAASAAAHARGLVQWMPRVEDIDGRPTKAGGEPTQPVTLVFIDKSQIPEFQDFHEQVLSHKAPPKERPAARDLREELPFFKPLKRDVELVSEEEANEILGLTEKDNLDALLPPQEPALHGEVKPTNTDQLTPDNPPALPNDPYLDMLTKGMGLPASKPGPKTSKKKT